MSKRLEKMADMMIKLTPDEQQKLQLIIKAKLLPEVAKQQQGLLQQQIKNPQMAQRLKQLARKSVKKFVGK